MGVVRNFPVTSEDIGIIAENVVENYNVNVAIRCIELEVELLENL